VVTELPSAIVALRDELVGTFELVSLESRRSDGEIAHPYGEQPIGMFVFDRAGRFSVQLTEPNRSPAQGGYVAMFGTYVVDDEHRTFTLTPRAAADPELIGTDVLRHVAFDGDLAIFHTPVQHVEGFDVTTYITWRRVVPS
jgi:Lipocalin-like domain